MGADQWFQLFNVLALVGWVVLAASVVMRRPFWRDGIAGRGVPLILSFVYLVLILLFFWRAEGGFDSLANVQQLFTSPWVALAGWVHYLAFDLFIGCWIAKEAETRGLPRWPLAVILPLTFLFGPIGLLGFFVLSRIVSDPRLNRSAAA
jgi:hypothetical protein